jgi:tetratricopeptide (TPR) repeat protein
LLGHRSLEDGDPGKALSFFQAATTAPTNLGEARHLLANESEAYYWIGVAQASMGNQQEAKTWWQKASRRQGDFQDMRVQTVSDRTYWNALALRALGRRSESMELLRAIDQYSRELEEQEAKIDYFATSLPAMLLFEEDLARRNQIAALFLRAQAGLGLGLSDEAIKLLKEVLSLDSNHSAAADLLQTVLSRSVSTAGLSFQGSDACTSPALPR